MTDQRAADTPAEAPETISIIVTTLYGDRVPMLVKPDENIGVVKAQAVIRLGLESTAAAHSRLRLPASTSLQAAENMMDSVGLDYYDIQDGEVLELVGYGSASSDNYKNSPWLI